MKYYKNSNGEIYAYEDDVSEKFLNQKIKELGLTSISDEEANKLLEPKIDEKARELAEIEAEISECENHIRHALFIGNTAVLESLRNEYKELIAQREELRK
ncbi:hypothetical protein B9N62_06960 [Campylobacter concisus]|uniref:ABC transporter ATP-binding protein n=1 Tax=Campylobacter concisus TaxID=199 RepID=A0A1Y5MR47_9BACT|nr:hypothetical protein [Campylobacter concisus]OUT11070.1 hypothetical protein B9N62_06960 [Campylobacter concisus]